ncbi:hypothetical protein ES708_24220 [subsurface metagenome]
MNLEVALEENPTSRDPHDLKPRPAQALEQILFSTVVGGAVIGQFTTVFVAITRLFNPNAFQALKMLGRLLEKAMVVGKLGGITLVGRGEAKPKDTVATLIPIAQKREDALKATFTLPIPTVVRTRFRHNVNE